MIPVSFAHKFGIYHQQIYPSRDPQHFLGGVRCQEEFEPIEILSLVKQQFNNMTNEQQPAVAAISMKEEQYQREQRSNTQEDAALVQPSFDDHGSRTASSPRQGHKQNLSEHFQDATRLTKGKSPETAQKHRRDYSDDVSNPAQAHRRTDSTGGSTSIQRGRPHRRIDSSGLDALTAAADFSREELEAATLSRHSWNQHKNPRRSPIETSATFEHAGQESGPVPHQSPPHLTPAVADHRHFPSLPSSGGLPANRVYYSHPAYPPPPYPHSYHYPHHPGNNGYGRHHGHPLHPPAPGGYPVQYARPHGQEPYMKHHTPLQQPTLERPHIDSPAHRSSPVASMNHPQAMAMNNVGMGPPAPPRWRQGGSTQGVQTYITGIGAGETTRVLQANPTSVHPPTQRSSPKAGHHRKLSSLSNLGPLFFGPPDPSGSGGPHHRSTSSSISFLNALDTNINESADATFLRNLQESTGTPAAAYSTAKLQDKKQPLDVPSSESSKLMDGGTSKRVRRKCTIVGCDNRVVQGGLCIAHGAKRKLCRHPGCQKHVKKAGLCSTHGPARKRCDVDNCEKVAVQGGCCIAHGAKKKLCSIDMCTKQAILSGMCKKHHDQKSAGEEFVSCTIIPKKNRPSKLKKPRHTRGLSIFQEISADAVGDLLTPVGDKQTAAKNGPAAASDPSSSAKAQSSSPHHRSTISQVLVDMV